MTEAKTAIPAARNAQNRPKRPSPSSDMGEPSLPPEILDLDIFLAFDYSQAEIRILAEISGDELLIKQFNTPDCDIHSLIGSQLTGWPPERIKAEKNLRKMVKNMVFGIIYGIGRENLYDYIVAKIRAIDGENADLTGITKKSTIELFDKFFRTYRGVDAYIKRYRKMAEELGFVPSIFGFKREIRQSEEGRNTYWLNQAINTPIQCSAHQLVLMAMALLHLKPKTYNLLQRPCMEVHDALYFFVRFRDLAKAYDQGLQLLQEEVVVYASKHFNRTLQIPMLAEASAGFCLGSLTKYHGEPINKFLDIWRTKHKEVEAKGWKELLETTDYES